MMRPHEPRTRRPQRVVFVAYRANILADGGMKNACSRRLASPVVPQIKRTLGLRHSATDDRHTYSYGSSFA
eukprot:scaffold303441_cov46-Prasinocladus_malaysianus.AAC.1